MWMKIRNTFIIFLVSGFWHGANWTFVVWGALNAAYFLPLMLTNNNRKNIEIVAKGRLFPSFREFVAMLTTFALAVFAWIFFRADSIHHAFSYIGGLFSKTLFQAPDFVGIGRSGVVWILVAFFFLLEWLGRDQPYALARFGLNAPRPLRWAFYYGLILVIYVFAGSQQQFIYFQF
jgi:D-alanyl-lipoteichoic acid acyltransferase DltB (MBOAT superfamily)